jgi:hypothetical protein
MATDIVAQEVYLDVRRDSSGLLSPPKSPRRPPVSPPPSSSLLKLQQLGLELGPSRSSLSLHAPSYNSSIRTTPSDLDKPLPLEPPEIDRRASSVYSVSTTISNIISLYNGHDAEEAALSSPQRAQAYRDTLAPLMAARYSGGESPPPLPLVIRKSSGAESPPPLADHLAVDSSIYPRTRSPSILPSPSIYQDVTPPMSPNITEVPALPFAPEGTTTFPPDMPQQAAVSPDVRPQRSPPISPAESKNAPSFSEFTRNLSQKRGDLVSPLSSEDTESYHRHLALAALAPPTPRESPNMHPVAFDTSDSHLTGPMSGTISHVIANDMIPPPLDLSRASRSVSPPGAAQHAQSDGDENSFEEFLQVQARKNSSIVSSTDKFVHYQPSIVPGPDQEMLTSQQFTEDEKHRIMSYASEKYPGMNITPQQKPKRSSTISSMSTRATGVIMRAMSVRKSVVSSATTNTAETARTSDWTPPRKNLAIQPTCYQLYGEASWEKDDKKKRRRDKRSSRESNKTDDGEKMGFFEVAKHKLTRTASEKRREKLKNKIKLVGPTEITKGVHAREDPRKWWE